MKKIITVSIVLALLVSGMGIAETLKDIAPSDFLFATGAGAWGTEMTVAEDLSFKGEYSDSEMGDIGEGYEYGSCYICSFEGVFSEPVLQEDGTSTMTVQSLTFANEPGTEMIEDNIRYVYDEAYGISQGDEFIFYPAGYATADMSEGAVEWAAMTSGWEYDNPPETLDTEVLYNVTGDYAFSRQVFDN